MKLQDVTCVRCGGKYTVELNGAKPYNKTTRAFWCHLCLETAVAQIHAGTYDPTEEANAV